jgi:uncharacterized membrane protein YeaQ/YmgE (transglycosylase-associated protein family)
MGITAWIAVGMAAGLLATMVLPGKRSQGFIFICLTCFTGALGGDWATSQFRTRGLRPGTPQIHRLHRGEPL